MQIAQNEHIIDRPTIRNSLTELCQTIVHICTANSSLRAQLSSPVNNF